MSCQKCVGPLPAASMSRRDVLSRFGMGLGGMALAEPRQPDHGVAQDRGSARRPTASSRQGQARHLSLHGRRAVADGDVRLQAGARQRNGEQLPTPCVRASA